MKTKIYTIVCCLLISFQLKAIKAAVEVYRFASDAQPYIEVNYRVFANSLHNDPLVALPEYEVLSTIMVYQDAEVVTYAKNLLKHADTTDMLDVQRFALDPGKYLVSVELSDPNGKSSTFKVEKEIEVAAVAKPSLSDVSLLAAAKSSDWESPLVKNGIYMEPAPYGVYDESQQQLLAYLELYKLNLSATDKYFLEYTILSGYKGQNAEPQLTKYKRIKPGEEAIHLLRMNIADLPSGAYHFNVQLRNAKKELVTSSAVNFLRDNPEADKAQLSRRSKGFENSFVHHIAEDSLNYYLQAVSPIAKEPLRSALDEAFASEDILTKKLYLHNYWKDQAGDQAELMCNAYMRVARIVDKQFWNGTSHGFDTDLGYIFLRYGKPDDMIIVDDEVSALPYQIWRYNHIAATGENNVKFLFYAPTLNHRDFELLHSTCRLELQNPSWEAEIYKKKPDDIIQNRDGGATVRDGITKRARDVWDDF